MKTLKTLHIKKNLKKKKRTLRFDVRGAITIQWGFVEDER